MAKVKEDTCDKAERFVNEASLKFLCQPDLREGCFSRQTFSATPAQFQMSSFYHRAQALRHALRNVDSSTESFKRSHLHFNHQASNTAWYPAETMPLDGFISFCEK